jgi:hypothetical protein
MHRIDADAHVGNLFSEGNPGIGQPGTEVDADWLNGVQESICQAIEAAGLTLVKGANTQLADAITAVVAAAVTSHNALTAAHGLTTAPPRTNLALLNTFAAASSWITPRYWKDSQGWVHVEGAARPGTGQAAVTPIAQLPVGYRPSGNVGFSAVVGASGSGYVRIDTSGNIVVEIPTNSGDLVTLDGIVFLP